MLPGRVRQPSSLADTRPVPYWLDQPAAPPPLPPLTGAQQCDLAVIGGGYSGLWTALLAKERDPGRDVVLVEGRKIAWGGSGRNGGFCSASITHGLSNGLDRFPDEMRTLERLGRENLDQIELAVARYGIDCDFARTGELAVATEQWQLDGLAQTAAAAAKLGARVRLLDAAQVRAELNSPTYLGGLWDTDGCATVDPARLAWGLRRACLAAGVRIYEHTPVTAIENGPGRLTLATPRGTVHANQLALAAGAFAPLLRRLRHFVVPVYDYVLMTKPLTRVQLDALGWRNRQGVGDSANQFHYYRLTSDNRILWGGYDAVYYYGGKIAASLDQRPRTFATLARHFYETFPRLDGLEFSHSWGGVIDTSSRFCAFFGTARSGRLAYAAGYTGLGVGASRFGANVMLDLLSGEPTERTRLRMVRSKPLPFPPEPVRAAGIGLTRWSLAQADRNDGRRNLWLRGLDSIGLGFDS
ncbi:MAG TPA: FAD-dependent oxidoreductase [Streptosporangiaceae bacterium]|nr:FAD-dependent oxidoreductase [Streptosporangiaceae bacterium]